MKCINIKKDKLTSDFSENTDRVKNRHQLNKILQNAITNFSSEKLMSDFIAHNVPAGIIKSVKEVFEDPKAKSLILSEQHENLVVSKRVKTAIFKLDN